MSKHPLRVFTVLWKRKQIFQSASLQFRLFYSSETSKEISMFKELRRLFYMTSCKICLLFYFLLSLASFLSLATLSSLYCLETELLIKLCARSCLQAIKVLKFLHQCNCWTIQLRFNCWKFCRFGHSFSEIKAFKELVTMSFQLKHYRL